MQYKTANYFDKPRVFDNLSNLVDKVVDGNSWGYDDRLDRANKKIETLTSMLAGLIEVLNLNEEQLSHVLGEKVEILLE